MTWNLSNPPVRPGHYLNFKSKPSSAILPSAAGTLFVPFTATWGPFKTVFPLPSYQDYIAVYGDDLCDGLVAVKNAFKGEGIDGFPGAGRVLGYRTGGSSARKASVTLQNTTPADAVVLTAKYEGTKANSFSVTVQTNALVNTTKDVLLYDGSTLLESYEGIDRDDMRALVALINSRSGWVDATMRTDAVDLANVTNRAMTGGDDGTTLATGDWTDVMNVAGTRDFAVFAPYGLTDSTVQAALATWQRNQNENGRRFEVVVGGGLNETITTAITRSLSFNSENVVNLGVGSYVDTEEEDWPVLTPARLAPRYAGILASRSIYSETTYARFAGLEFAPGAGTAPDETAILSALSNGVVVIAEDSHPLSPLRVEKGLTTYTTRTDLDKTYATFSPPKFVMTMHEFERRMKIFAIMEIITPGLAVNRDTREFAVAHAQSILREWEGSVVQAGTWKVGVALNPPPTPTDNFINLDYEWTFARTAEQVRGTAFVM